MEIDVNEAEQEFNNTASNTLGTTNETLYGSKSFEDFISDPGEFVKNVVDSDTTKQTLNGNLVSVSKNRTKTDGTGVWQLTADYDHKVTNLTFDGTASFTTFCENNCADHELLVLPVNNA